MTNTEAAAFSPAPHSLVPPPGPWMDEVWSPDETRPSAGSQRVTAPCAIGDCTRPAVHRSIVRDGVRLPSPSPLCKAHHSRWSREGRPDIGAFVDAQKTAKPFRIDPQRGIGTIPMGLFPEPFRTEVRYAVGTLIVSGDWTIALSVRRFLIHFCGFLREELPTGTASITDHDDAWWSTRFATYCTAQGFSVWLTRDAGERLRSVRRLVVRVTDPNPWRHDRWTAIDVGWTEGATGAIDWRRITTPWLRDALKRYAEDVLRARRKSWSTVQDWAAAGTQLDEYLVSVGLTQPQDVSRKVFKSYLHWVNDRWNNKTRRARVNRIASVLGDLFAEDYEPRLTGEALMRHAENPTTHTPSPKPIPPDVVSDIEKLIETAPELTVTLRRMFQFIRQTGPRPSEAIVLPLDALRVTVSGGYWIEYWQSKIEDWRRFPISDYLGHELAAQAAWVREIYGPRAAFMFPNPRSSAARTNDFEGRCRPYSTNTLRARLQQIFDRHDLRPSRQTSEQYTGGQLHRFRHTVATELLNNGFSQYEVQQYIGHKSATMTGYYAKINDDELAKKYRQSAGMVDRHGQPAALVNADETVERLREKAKKAALPNGFCGLPEDKKCKFRPNPCLSCDFFRTNKTFLGVHIRHRDEVEAIVRGAHADGNTRIAEINEPMLEQLNELIPKIQAAPDDNDVSIDGIAS